MKRLEIVDFLKGFAIFTIVLMHLLMQFNIDGIFSKCILFGGAGVHVFILCSGFGLYLSYLFKPIGYGDFLKKRFFRVYIPYAILICIIIFTPVYYYDPEKWHNMLSHILLYKMFFESYDTSFGYTLWYVSTIFQFYICWPLIVCVYKRLKANSSYLTIFIGIAISLSWATITAALGKDELRVWNSFFLQYMWEFVLGMCFADYYFKKGSLPIPTMKVLIPMAIIGLTISGIAGMMGGIFKQYNDIPSMVGYLSLALIVFKIKIFNRPFIFTNKFSYEWYLVHGLVFILVARAFSHFGHPINTCPILFFFIAFASSYILAILYQKALKLLHIL